MVDFRKFAVPVQDQFKEMSKGELYVTDINPDELYEAYLDSFPAGTNEIYRTRREYDCSSDRHFIKNVGNLVSIQDGKVSTIWDVKTEYPFDVVSNILAEKVRNGFIVNVFRTKESTYGNEILRELREDGSIHNWYNFNVKIDTRHKTNDVAEIKGNFATKSQVFKRGLEELTPAAINTVKDLIKDDLIYRGAEHSKKVTDFAALHAKYQKLNSDEARNIFIWENIGFYGIGFKNEVIGSLVEDLSKGVDLESAVKKFEAKVAPQNYKRSKSLITPAMIRDAMKTIKELGLETALERRYARISDVTVNNVLFVDNSVRGAMKGGIEGLLMSATQPKPVKLDKGESVHIDKFLESVLPGAKSIEVLVKNSMLTNFMSLTAPVHDEVERLFKWDNNFAWSYDGNVTDSGIKQKVARAGGNVTNAALRISLAWNNYDDLDIHVMQPNGKEINFVNKDGKLDVDMNAGGPSSREPVENVSYTDANFSDGIYKVSVNQYSRRESIDVGYSVEVESNGSLYNYSYDKPATGKKLVVTIEVKNKVITKITPAQDITGTAMSREKWNVKTESLVPVDTIILSPNYWDEQRETGNKHWFFILKNCFNPEPCRGIYNEYLSSALDKHRKVFEILGDKTKCVPETGVKQLSGLGFSSTKRDTLTAVVNNRVYNIQF